MSKPWVVFGEFVPGRALVARGDRACFCGSTVWNLGTTGHAIRCAGCGMEELVIHTGGGEASDLLVAGFDYAVPDSFYAPAHPTGAEG